MRRFFCMMITGFAAMMLLVSCGGGSGSGGSGGSVSSGIGSFFSSLFRTQGGSFSRSYGGDDDNIAYAIQQTRDGGYVVAGKTYASGAGLSDLWVLKLNADGTVAWQKAYGGDDDESAYAVQQTADGGYIVAGETYSSGAGDNDMVVLKLRSDGTPEWENTYGDSGSDSANAVQQTSDGGYIVAGYTNDGSGSGAWVLKLNSDGSVAWQKAYGGSGDEVAKSIRQTADGGYVVAGDLTSYNNGTNTMLVLKLAVDGRVEWQRTYRNSYADSANAIQQTADGGYVVAGLTSNGDADAWVVKLSSTGDIAWQKSYGGSSGEVASSIRQTPDGGYIVAGETRSFGAGGADAWVLKLTDSGDIAWQMAYGGDEDDTAKAIQPTADGGYVFAGSTASFGSGNAEAWVLKMNSSGTAKGLGTVTNASAADTNAAATASAATVSTTNSAPVPAGFTMTDTTGNTVVSKQTP